MFSFVLIGFLLTSASGLPFFPDYEEAKWELVDGEQPEDHCYEYRRYFSSMWVSTSVSGVDFDKCGREAFWRLFRYIKGENGQKLEIPMTVPVTTEFADRPCPFCNITYTMNFYIPMKYQNLPPEPTDPLVTLTRFPERTYYVRRFGGYANANDWRSKAAELYGSLQEKGITGIDLSSFLAVGYDSPYKFFWRRNEVWLSKQNNSTINW